jgi:hypothetical protein
MANEPTHQPGDTAGKNPAPGKEVKPLNRKANPFKSGFVPNGRGKKHQGGYMTKRNLLKTMLDVPITVKDLPTEFADVIRKKVPGFLDNVDRKFTMYNIMELVQIQLLFSKSDYVKQDAINAIKDRVEGKPMQKIQVENMEAEPTQFVLPGGRIITI